MAPDIKNMQSLPKNQQILLLESMARTDSRDNLDMLVAYLDDADIQIRGEAFGALLLNENNITDILIEYLGDPRRNIRAFVALVLGNRREVASTAALVELASDPSPLVRSCALGALGHMRYAPACGLILQHLDDPDMSVKRSAFKAALDAGCDISDVQLRHISSLNDDELDIIAASVMHDRNDT